MNARFVFALMLVATSTRADDMREWTVPQKAWFGAGNGRPYVHQMAFVDMTVALSITTIEMASWAPTLRVEGSAESPFPTMILAPLAPLAAPITHFAHGRILPGVLSLFGWPLVDGGVALATFFSAFGGEQDAVVRANLLTTFAGETLMLILDTLMASGSPH